MRKGTEKVKDIHTKSSKTVRAPILRGTLARCNKVHATRCDGTICVRSVRLYLRGTVVGLVTYRALDTSSVHSQGAGD